MTDAHDQIALDKKARKRAYDVRRRETHKDALREYQAKYYRENRNSIIAKSKEYAAANPEKVKGYKETWNEKHPEFRAVYAKKNSKTIVARVEVWARNNPEKVKRNAAKYRANHVEEGRIRVRSRRAAMRNIPSEKYTTQQILVLYGADCHICKEPIDLRAPRVAYRAGWQLGLHLDHVIPLARGGSDLVENIRPSHAICNIKKSARLDYVA